MFWKKALPNLIRKWQDIWIRAGCLGLNMNFDIPLPSKFEYIFPLFCIRYIICSVFSTVDSPYPPFYLLHIFRFFLLRYNAIITNNRSRRYTDHIIDTCIIWNLLLNNFICNDFFWLPVVTISPSSLANNFIWKSAAWLISCNTITNRQFVLLFNFSTIGNYI